MSGFKQKIFKKTKNLRKNSDTYTKRMPYSLCVPRIFAEIKEFVNNCVKFADGLNSR